LWDEATGLPTQKGLINGLSSALMAVALGTAGPEARMMRGPVDVGNVIAHVNPSNADVAALMQRAGLINAPIAMAPGMSQGMTAAGATAADLENSLASRSYTLHNAPDKPPRPFEEDYRAGASADGSGRLTTDIDGRPLGAGFIAGRRALGGADEAVSPAEFDALSEAAIGTWPKAVAPRQIRGDAAQFVKTADPETGDALYNIYVNPRELWASAIHAYLTNPNYLKTVAPETAKAIRAAVNANSRLKDIIQFNGIAGLTAGAGAASGDGQPNVDDQP
jgi:hypothetical protein